MVASIPSKRPRLDDADTPIQKRRKPRAPTSALMAPKKKKPGPGAAKPDSNGLGRSTDTETTAPPHSGASGKPSSTSQDMPTTDQLHSGTSGTYPSTSHTTPAAAAAAAAPPPLPPPPPLIPADMSFATAISKFGIEAAIDLFSIEEITAYMSKVHPDTQRQFRKDIENSLSTQDQKMVEEEVAQEARTVLRMSFFPYCKSMNMSVERVREVLCGEFEKVYGEELVGPTGGGRGLVVGGFPVPVPKGESDRWVESREDETVDYADKGIDSPGANQGMTEQVTAVTSLVSVDQDSKGKDRESVARDVVDMMSTENGHTLSSDDGRAYSLQQPKDKIKEHLAEDQMGIITTSKDVYQSTDKTVSFPELKETSAPSSSQATPESESIRRRLIVKLKAPMGGHISALTDAYEERCERVGRLTNVLRLKYSAGKQDDDEERKC